MWRLSGVLVVLGLPVLAACGFQPLYAAREKTLSTNDQMAQVRVDVIEAGTLGPQESAFGPGRIELARLGQQLRNKLLDEFNPDGRPSHPLYALHVDLRETEIPVAIDRAGTSQRDDVEIYASYKLLSLTDAKVVLSGTTTMTNSYGIIANPYATVVGRADAEDRATRGIAEDIVRRVALYLERRSSPEN